jgi:hypothetical protein
MKFLDLYCTNPKIKMLVMLQQQNNEWLVRSRALLWEDVQVTKDNLFNLDTVNITNAEIFDDLEDTLSIATAPIDETNDVINHTNNFNLDDIQDIPDIDDLDNLESIDIKTVQLNVATSEDNDISQLLNGNINQSKNIESHQNEKQSMKTKTTLQNSENCFWLIRRNNYSISKS